MRVTYTMQPADVAALAQAVGVTASETAEKQTEFWEALGARLGFDPATARRLSLDVFTAEAVATEVEAPPAVETSRDDLTIHDRYVLAALTGFIARDITDCAQWNDIIDASFMIADRAMVMRDARSATKAQV